MTPVAAMPTTATDWRSLPLDAGGRSLIEASAGTGKTWTIAALYLRLLLERGLSPRQVVVTTFTEAAAGELRERIRRQLVVAERLAQAWEHGADPLGAAATDDRRWLHERWTQLEAKAGEGSIRADLHRLRLAIAELDLAPITTLHGLCRRILADFPFESGSAFAAGELVSSDGLLASLADDVWRLLQQGPEAPSRPPPDCTSSGYIAKRLRAYLAPGVSIPPALSAEALEVALPRDMSATLLRIADRKIFLSSRRTLKPALRKLADYLASHPRDNALLPKPENLVPKVREEHLSSDALADPEVLAVLAFAAKAAKLFEFESAVSPWRYWVERARQWRAQRLAAANQLTFDELVESVHAALAPGGSALADRLCAEWPVALVDEFQDTDALQYGILDRIYRDPDDAQRGRLVMIGDPKQAIYRFRGGDIHAYLKARDDAGSRLELSVNHRSSRPLVAAFNALYDKAGVALGSQPDQPIRYAPVQPGPRADEAPYTIDGVACAQPLQLHYWADCPDDADGRRSRALEACANQVVELLGSGRHRLGDRALEPGDIAVLLPTNPNVAELGALLRRRRVPFVSTQKSSVFQSDWARELQLVLHAAHHARDEAAVRAALATRLGGLGYADLRALRDDPRRWQPHAARFERLGQRWRSRGVLAVVGDVIEQAGPRLLAAGDGERSLTDLRHLGELLQAASEDLAGPEELLGWLAAERSPDADAGGDAADEMQLRIESDARRVRLLTLHASKGLEFPVVILPLMWANKHRGDIVLLHDADTGLRVPGAGKADDDRYVQEGQDERFRLLYVALTRARNACHVYVLPPHRAMQANKTDPDTDPNRAPLDTMVERMFPNLARGEQPTHVHDHIAWNGDGWAWPFATLASGEVRGTTPRVALAPPKAAPFTYKWSFSTLTKSGRAGLLEEDAANDEGDPDDTDPGRAGALLAAADALDAAAPEPAQEEESPHPELLGLATIAGAEFGNALHAMFELREVGVPMAAQHGLIRAQLLHSGVRLGDLELEPLVARLARRIQATLDAPIALGDGEVVRLGALPKHQLRAEMAFDYVLDGVALDRLRQACADAGDPDLVPRTAARHLRGLMNGKIDLVFEHAGRFHVLDYKGNRLGREAGGEGRVSSYAPARLAVTMDANHYRFQALLYVVAVERYLRQRLGAAYDRRRHLGEAIYLFVRAAGLAPGAGVWTHRFPDDLLDGMQAVLGLREDPAA